MSIPTEFDELRSYMGGIMGCETSAEMLSELKAVMSVNFKAYPYEQEQILRGITGDIHRTMTELSMHERGISRQIA